MALTLSWVGVNNNQDTREQQKQHCSLAAWMVKRSDRVLGAI
jgi:hypothetical protein